MPPEQKLNSSIDRIAVGSMGLCCVYLSLRVHHSSMDAPAALSSKPTSFGLPVALVATGCHTFCAGTVGTPARLDPQLLMYG